MKLTIDDQIATSQAHGGISRYFSELIKEFRTDRSLGVQVESTPYVQSSHYLAAGIGRSLPGPFGTHPSILRAANRVIAYFRNNKPDIVHHTYYDDTYLKQHASGPFRVTTIYDMIPELLPEFFPQGNPHLDKRAYVESADLILCISESTKRDLLSVYGSQQAPIVVTPLGVDPLFSATRPRVSALPQQYVLYVGLRAGYKDFPVLAQAFAQASLPTGIVLLAVGGGPFSPEERQDFQRLGIRERVKQISLSDHDLASAYAHAFCFVYPSRYEGFGLPTLEAMASGCPTILARSSSHPEVGGDAAVYFQPGHVEDLAAALERLGTEADQRTNMVASGLRRAASFSWRRTAKLTARAYATLGRS
jgi:glycosyltransferase involved in cell wall biosynthesis